MRRYWLCNARALDALAGALDPPDWEESGIPTTIICLDERALATCGPFARGAETQVVDATERGAFTQLMTRLIASDHARYIQLCTRAIADFAPSIELLRERLESAAPPMLRGQIAHVGSTATRFGASDQWRDPAGAPLRASLAPEGVWIESDLLRRSMADAPLDAAAPATLAALVLGASAAAGGVDEMRLIVGARFVEPDEDGDCAAVALDAFGAGADPAVIAAARADASGRYVIDDLALDDAEFARRLAAAPTPAPEWRARAAAGLARVDWLEVDQRLHWIRENARTRKARRDEERRRVELAAEIARLQARLRGPRLPARWKRGRLGKALGWWA